MHNSDIIATVGVSLLLIAFFLQSIKMIKSDGFLYLCLNLLGAIIAGYASWIISFFPFVLLEGVWALVALFGLLNYFYKKMFHVKHTRNNGAFHVKQN